MNEYKEFIKKHFPYSGIINNENIELLYLRICENNVITEIYEKYITLEGKEQNITFYIEFLYRYRSHINNLLLYIPINEPNGINFCMRAAIENLLKFLYSIYSENNLRSITVCKFRDIREYLNKVSTDLYINRDMINILINYYGKFSNSVHDKNCDNKAQIEYMESIIETNELNLLDLDNKLLQILNIYEKLVNYIFKISEKTLAVGETMKIKNTLPNKRFQKIKLNLYEEK